MVLTDVGMVKLQTGRFRRFNSLFKSVNPREFDHRITVYFYDQLIACTLVSSAVAIEKSGHGHDDQNKANAIPAATGIVLFARITFTCRSRSKT